MLGETPWIWDRFLSKLMPNQTNINTKDTYYSHALNGIQTHYPSVKEVKVRTRLLQRIKCGSIPI
jgi:hypothetical protein